MQVHSRALSRDEVYELYAAGVHGMCELPDTEPDPFMFVDQTFVHVSTTDLTLDIGGVVDTFGVTTNGELIFADGFDLGDTSAWSEAVR